MKTRISLSSAGQTGLLFAASLTLGWADTLAGDRRSAPVVLPPVLVEGTNTCPWKLRAGVSFASVEVAVSQCGKLLTTNHERSWHQVEPAMRTFFRNVTVGRGQFVAVGGSYVDLPGVILSSSDGANWRIRRAGSKSILRGVTYGNNLFVAVGDRGMILTSRDGADWKPRRPVFDGTLASVAYGNGRFVAVGDDGTVLISTNGRQWLRGSTGTSTYLGQVEYRAGRFAARGHGTMLTSSDGLDWTTEPADVAMTPFTLIKGQDREIRAGEK